MRIQILKLERIPIFEKSTNSENIQKLVRNNKL